jgi:hypothetical protein
MTRQTIIIGNNIYKSQTECKNDIRNKLIEIGITKSIKCKSIDSYNFFIDLCKRHPNHENKLKNIIDFEIRQDVLNKKGLALNIINNNETTTEISWIICVCGKYPPPQQLFNMALRHSISPQIQAYRENTDISICSICNKCLKDKMFHVDHEIQFAKLVSDFTHLHNIIIPIEYDKLPTTFEKTFKLNDKWIGDLFFKYHLEHAKLRILCENCNLTREKYKA